MQIQAKALLTDDFGKDLASVEALIRRHDELERDLTAIESKLEVQAIDILLILDCLVIYYYSIPCKQVCPLPMYQFQRVNVTPSTHTN